MKTLKLALKMPDSQTFWVQIDYIKLVVVAVAVAVVVDGETFGSNFFFKGKKKQNKTSNCP